MHGRTYTHADFRHNIDYCCHTLLSTATEEYGWHIHAEPINESAPADKRCETAGPHYDPENIQPTSCNYGKDCNTNYPMKLVLVHSLVCLYSIPSFLCSTLCVWHSYVTLLLSAMHIPLLLILFTSLLCPLFPILIPLSLSI